MNMIAAIAAAALLAGTIIATGTTRAADRSAREIMEKVDRRDDGDRSAADLEMTLIDKKGNRRTRTIRSFGMDDGEDRWSLMFFLSPADVKGTGFLSYDYKEAGKDKDQWLFLPALKKTKRIAGGDRSGSFMGSDFTYADLTRKSLEDYDYSFYGKQPEVEVHGKKAWVIESVPRREEIVAETGYARSILFVRQDNHMVVRAVHTAKKGGCVKYFDVKRVELIDGIWTGLELEMTKKKGNQTVHRTLLTFSNVRYNNEKVGRDLFTLRRLEKGP